MTDSLQINQSTPQSGLGTFTYTVTSATAGLITAQIKSFIPYQAAGSPAVTTVQSVTSTNVTCAADTAGSKNSTYWTFNSAGDLYGFYVWYNINSAGVDPAPAGLTGIQVAGATGATAATLATATIAAINASTAASYVLASAGTSGHVIVTNIQVGTCTDAANGTASYGASFSITAGSYGVPAGSGLDIVIKKNTTVLARVGFPSYTQPLMSGSATTTYSSGDTINFVLSSLSTADAQLNAVKSIINIFQGE